MFWDRFFALCQRNGKKPNPVGKEIGLSSGIISKWKNGGIPTGETLIKLARYFDVSVDYLLGLSTVVEVEETQFEPFVSDIDLKKTVLDSFDKLNIKGLSCLAEYSEYLTQNAKYTFVVEKSDKSQNKNNVEE